MLPLDTSSRETGETDSTLITELLSIQLDMKTYQQDKKQLQWEEQCFDSCRAAKAIISFASVLTKWHVCALSAWQKLRDVLKGWLQTSGKDDRMETKAVCEELEEVGTLLFSLVIILTRGKQHLIVISMYKSGIVSTHLQIQMWFSFGGYNWCSEYFTIQIPSHIHISDSDVFGMSIIIKY